MESDFAHAHIKWFDHYDLNQLPLPIGEVVTPQFVYFFLGSVLLIYVFFWFDRYVYRKRILDDVLRRFTVSAYDDGTEQEPEPSAAHSRVRPSAEMDPGQCMDPSSMTTSVDSGSCGSRLGGLEWLQLARLTTFPVRVPDLAGSTGSTMLSP